MQYCQNLYYGIVVFDSSMFVFLLWDTHSLRTRHYRLHTKLRYIQENDCAEMELSQIQIGVNVIDHIVCFDKGKYTLTGISNKKFQDKSECFNN